MGDGQEKFLPHHQADPYSLKKKIRTDRPYQGGRTGDIRVDRQATLGG